ncbi:MAG: type I-E CRISPR-associated protein Cas6/Cse3/CasE [Deltaproteobacteria bacterium]|nr:type I-E CRISPR-associated protein Cas6/Cse3/CasE [Deltaproteobacteria bacterium]
MIASILSLDRSAIKKFRISDPYSLHRVVYSLFLREQDGRVLYVDQGGNSLGRKILILSTDYPKKEGATSELHVDSRVVPDGFLNYQLYRFKITLNPSKRNRATGKRQAIVGHKELISWFCFKSESQWGFVTPEKNLQIDKIEVLSFEAKDGRKITLNQVTFSGVLFPRDAERFNRSFVAGIGSAKAFGCGLLQITPVIDNIF